MSRPIVIVLLLAAWNPFRQPDADVAAGNHAVAEKRWDDALAAYTRASAKADVDPDVLAYDRAIAEAGKADTARDPAEHDRWVGEATADLQRAARAADPKLRATANYDRGNLAMRRGDAGLDDAIEAYKQALRDDAAMGDARANLEVALQRRQQQRAQTGSKQSKDQPPSSGSGEPNAGSNGSQSPPSSPPQQPPTTPPSGQPQQPHPGQPPSTPPGQNPAEPPRAGNAPPQPPDHSPHGDGAKSPSGRSPTDRRLDDLETVSRRLQRESARRRASGRDDPDHDW